MKKILAFSVFSFSFGAFLSFLVFILNSALIFEKDSFINTSFFAVIFGLVIVLLLSFLSKNPIGGVIIPVLYYVGFYFVKALLREINFYELLYTPYIYRAIVYIIIGVLFSSLSYLIDVFEGRVKSKRFFSVKTPEGIPFVGLFLSIVTGGFLSLLSYYKWITIPDGLYFEDILFLVSIIIGIVSFTTISSIIDSFAFVLSYIFTPFAIAGFKYIPQNFYLRIDFYIYVVTLFILTLTVAVSTATGTNKLIHFVTLYKEETKEKKKEKELFMPKETEALKQPISNEIKEAKEEEKEKPENKLEEK